MDVGTSGKDSRRYINISEIATKGKKRPLKIAEENYSFLDAFAALATGEVDRATCEALEEYTSLGTLLKPECHELFFLSYDAIILHDGTSVLWNIRSVQIHCKFSLSESENKQTVKKSKLPEQILEWPPEL
ncbi:hypothetical protein GQR58_022189 [Nymphon striatum]|nr:hypothetical protein GQR58_022189 [Nymphon striatum]